MACSRENFTLEISTTGYWAILSCVSIVKVTPYFTCRVNEGLYALSTLVFANWVKFSKIHNALDSQCEFPEKGRTFRMTMNEINIHDCAVKPFDILRVKNAFVKSVYCGTALWIAFCSRVMPRSPRTWRCPLLLLSPHLWDGRHLVTPAAVSRGSSYVAFCL